jgi:hypothetical protein
MAPTTTVFFFWLSYTSVVFLPNLKCKPMLKTRRNKHYGILVGQKEIIQSVDNFQDGDFRYFRPFQTYDLQNLVIL